MKWQIAAVAIGAVLWATPALSQGCDTKPGRDGGQAMCGSGTVCTGPYEGSYGRGNCQPRKGCDTKPGRAEGQEKCPSSMVCTGPFEGRYGRGNCQPPK